MGKVIAVCLSEKRGTQKQNVHSARFLTNFGIENDAHAGDWHRQVSLLSYDKILAFNARGAQVQDGAFGENLVVEGIDFRALPVGTALACGEVLLQMTQIGKECHSHCEIYHKMGECIMPTEGVFARVLRGGTISEGDEMRIVSRVAIITASDKGFAGEREDESAAVIRALVEENGFAVVDYTLLPDDRERLAARLRELCDSDAADVILTTGGTGLSPRDVTPEATLDVAQRMVPGIAEAMRAESMRITKRAMLSRGVAAVRGGTLIINLPGSPKAVRENLSCVLPALSHAVETLRGRGSECAAPANN